MSCGPRAAEMHPHAGQTVLLIWFEQHNAPGDCRLVFETVRAGGETPVVSVSNGSGGI
jgi:hypothetical protein